MPKATISSTVMTARRMLATASSAASQTGSLANVRPFPSTVSLPPKKMPRYSLTRSLNLAPYSLVMISLPRMVSMRMGRPQVP